MVGAEKSDVATGQLGTDWGQWKFTMYYLSWESILWEPLILF